MDQKTINELELSITFGQKLVKYKRECIRKMLEIMHDNDKIRQFYEADKLYIQDIILALELGEGMQHLSHVKSRLTMIGQMFFKKEFKLLKNLT